MNHQLSNSGDQAIINYPDFNALLEDNNNTIFIALTKLENIIQKFSVPFFNSFYDLDYQGLNFYFTSDLTPQDLTVQISNPAAYSLIKDQKYMIVLDINQPNLEEIICHELMHNIELNLSHKYDIFTNWESLNPPNFYYNNSYTSPIIFDYTLNESNPQDVYFTDDYAHTYPDEDRARIFENICTNSSVSLLKYPNLLKKAQYLAQEISQYYPNLTIFESLK